MDAVLDVAPALKKSIRGRGGGEKLPKLVLIPQKASFVNFSYTR